MAAAIEPITVTISHRLGRDEAKRRIDRALDAVRREIAPFAKSIEYAWHEYRLGFGLTVLAQRITGRIDVYDNSVRVEFVLPRLLHLLARPIATRIQQRGLGLLKGPKEGT
jgi:putative polyhydroxyalkanoic acid system protein